MRVEETRARLGGEGGCFKGLEMEELRTIVRRDGLEERAEARRAVLSLDFPKGLQDARLSLVWKLADQKVPMLAFKQREQRTARYMWDRGDRGCPLVTVLDPPVWHASGTAAGVGRPLHGDAAGLQAMPWPPTIHAHRAS